MYQLGTNWKLYMFIITILLILFFLFASSIKILGWQKFIFETQLIFFKKYGLNRRHLFLVGIVELSASLLLATSLLVKYDVLQALGALGIAFTSIGAIYFHLRFDTFKDSIPAVITLIFSTTLLAFNDLFVPFFA